MEHRQSKPGAAPTAALVALACALQVSESLIPHPVPGVRLGLANVISMIALVVHGLGYALEIAVLRTLLSSLALGSFLSPSFFLSFGGAVSSTLAMGLLLRASRWQGRPCVGVFGLSVAGAFVHNMAQLLLAYFLLVRHAGLFVFLPVLGVSAVAAGCLNGAVAGGVLRRLSKAALGVGGRAPSWAGGEPRPGGDPPCSAWAGRLPVRPKIAFVLAVCVVAFLVTDIRLLASLLACLLSVALACGVPTGRLLARVRRVGWLVATAFALPVLFGGGAGAGQWAAGAAPGALAALRIVALVLASGLLVGTTSPASLAQGLGAFLWPLRLLGMRNDRAAHVLALALDAMPEAGRSARQAVAEARLTKPRGLRRFVGALSDLVAGLYLGMDREEAVAPADAAGG